MLYRDSEYHPGSLVGRMSALRARVGNSFQARLGVPQMATVRFTMSDPEIPDRVLVLKVVQAGAQTVKAYLETSVDVKMEDLIIKDVPRSCPIEIVRYSMVIIGKPPATERAKVVWVDERSLTTFDVIVRTLQQR